MTLNKIPQLNLWKTNDACQYLAMTFICNSDPNCDAINRLLGFLTLARLLWIFSMHPPKWSLYNAECSKPSSSKKKRPTENHILCNTKKVKLRNLLRSSNQPQRAKCSHHAEKFSRCLSTNCLVLFLLTSFHIFFSSYPLNLWKLLTKFNTSVQLPFYFLFVF